MSAWRLTSCEIFQQRNVRISGDEMDKGFPVLDFFFFFAAALGIQGLSSPTRDQTTGLPGKSLGHLFSN